MTTSDRAVPPGVEGLTPEEAARRLVEHGPNRWVAHDRWERVRDLAGLLLDPMAVMLAVAAGLYAALGETTDAIVLAVAVVPVLGVDVLLEARSHAALRRLAEAAAPRAAVLRAGQVLDVPLETVVPGDLVVLTEGHVAPADGEVLQAANLTVDESSISGEAEPQSKEAGTTGPAGLFRAGTLVVTGHGVGRVTATGPQTAYGRVAALVAGTTPAPSPLQTRTAQLVRRLGVAAVGIAAALAAVGVARGLPWQEALLGAVSLAVAAIPDEFPLVLTIFLSAGAWRLASRGMLVRRLASVETLGATTVICVDKTGTLTRGSFEAVEHAVLADGTTPGMLLEMALLACERHPADAMEQALLRYAQGLGVEHDAVVGPLSLVYDYDFDPSGRHMSHVWRRGADEYIVAAKGALEGVLEHATEHAGARARAVAANAAMAARGLRVLTIGGRRMPAPGRTRDENERDLVIHGLIGFQDPVRPEVPAAVAECQRAGIAVRMVTGDHALTAHAVAEVAGIWHEDSGIVTGDELAALDPPARHRRILEASIFARISPTQKFEIVDALRVSGAVVAMTGDGVNDAAALRRADIGIAMGQRGTDVARATADLVLLDDNFASIAETVREGRHLFANIQRAFLYLIAFHVPIVGLAALMPVMGLPLLLLPIHLVWLELIVHPVSVLVFQAEPVTPAVMSRGPRAPGAPLLPGRAVLRSILTGLALTAVAAAMYMARLETAGVAAARTSALIGLLAGYQVLILAERRALPESGLPLVPRGGLFWGVWVASGVSLPTILAVPSVATLFHVAAPGWPVAMVAAAAGSAAVLWRMTPNAPGR